MTGSRRALIVVAVLFAALLGLPGVGAVREASAQISVTAADPKTGEQGSLNLSVNITGKGFKNGAKAEFYKTKTTDPAGVNVKSTQFVSSTQLVVLVDIADAAALAMFDIQVANTDGRTGKGTELFSVVAKGRTSLDVPLIVEFADRVGPMQLLAGWYGDGAPYESVETMIKGQRPVTAEITYYDIEGWDPAGGLTFLLHSAGGRRVNFDFSRPVVDPNAAWCPEACPNQPTQGPPDFSADPIKDFAIYDTPQYSPPNYDFLNPTWCESVWEGNLCPNDFSLQFGTASGTSYRVRFSPNIWRALALPNTSPYGVMGVAYDPASDSWTLSPLLSRTIGGVVREEPCPVLVERKDVVRRVTTYVSLGCYDMPFEITLTKR